MNKAQITNFIQKYHLNGLIETLKLESNNNVLSARFITATKDLVGEVVMNSSPFTKDDIYIYDTSRLLKLLSITDGDLNVSLEGGKFPTKLHISDGNHEISYSLADMTLIPKVPNVKTSNVSFEFTLDKDLKSRIIKANSAVGDSDIIWIGTYTDVNDDKIQLSFGENGNHSNKISMFLTAKSITTKSSLIPFSSSQLKEILNANKDDDALVQIDKEGLMKISFQNELITSTYFIIRKKVQ